MTLVENMTVSELEAIKLCVKRRRSGAKKQLESYMKKGKLHGQSSINALMKNLETLCERVEVAGEGKNREYNLFGIKNRPTKKKTNHKGTPSTEHDLILKEYVMSRLVELQQTSVDGSYKYWTERIGMPKANAFIYGKIKEHLINEYNEDDDTLPSYIYNQYSVDLDRRSKSYVETAFNNLSKEGRIKLTKTYYRVTRVEIKSSDEFNEYRKEVTKITKNDYDSLQRLIDKKCEEYGLTKKEFTDMNLYSYKKFDIDKRMSRQYIEEELLDEYNLHGIFKGVKVKILNDVSKDVSKNEFFESFYNKFLKNSLAQFKKDKYQNSGFENEAFYYFHHLILVKSLGLKGLDEEIKAYRPDQSSYQTLDERRLSYVINKQNRSDMHSFIIEESTQ